jgi:hypothetical protein
MDAPQRLPLQLILLQAALDFARLNDLTLAGMKEFTSFFLLKLSIDILYRSGVGLALSG